MNKIYTPITFDRNESEGFFISPDNKIFCNNGRKHIDVIINHPEIFNLTTDYLKAQYKKHNEPYGFEGIARKEIIQQIIKQDWIHLRYFPRNGKWKFNIGYSDENYIKLLSFINIMKKKNYILDNDYFEIQRFNEHSTLISSRTYSVVKSYHIDKKTGSYLILKDFENLIKTQI